MLVQTTVFGYDLEMLFGKDYQDANDVAAAMSSELSKYASRAGEDKRLLEALVFPELMRYNNIYDAIQTGSLVTLYTRFGRDYADFSIGHFQMKPSFAETIDVFINHHRELPWIKDLETGILKTDNDFQSRKERVERLRDETWQIKYLIAFVKICKLKFALKNGTSESDFRLLATAYNSGFEKSPEEIKSYAFRKFFTIHSFEEDGKYNYSTLAWYRYQELQLTRAW